MNINQQNIEIAAIIRAAIQEQTMTISDGESVAMIVLYTFIGDHARVCGHDHAQLFIDQVNAFIEFAKENIKYVEHLH